jgi:hypothetical protein
MDTAPVTNPPTATCDSMRVGAAWLEARLPDPAVRVVEVDVSRAAYDGWHIGGAVLWNICADLKDGGYRLADPAAAGRLLARPGIGPDTTVVFYGYEAAMGLRLMKLFGHADARIARASTAWLVLAHPPGRGNVRVYDGSWAACPMPRWTRPDATGTARHHPEGTEEATWQHSSARASTRPRKSAGSRRAAATWSW